jgi:hypothetical protein
MAFDDLPSSKIPLANLQIEARHGTMSQMGIPAPGRGINRSQIPAGTWEYFSRDKNPAVPGYPSHGGSLCCETPPLKNVSHFVPGRGIPGSYARPFEIHSSSQKVIPESASLGFGRLGFATKHRNPGSWIPRSESPKPQTLPIPVSLFENTSGFQRRAVRRIRRSHASGGRGVGSFGSYAPPL